MFGWKTTGLSLGLLLTSCGGTDPEAEPLAVPSLQVDSQRVDVGSARLRETTEQEVVLRNTGDLAMGVRAIKTDGAPFSVVVVDGEAWAEAEEDGAVADAVARVDLNAAVCRCNRDSALRRRSAFGDGATRGVS